MTEIVFRQQIEKEIDIHLAIHRATSEVKKRAFDEVKLAKLKTVMSELGHNIIKYAKRGTLTMFNLNNIKKGIQIVAADKGPGIADVEQAMKDNFSSSGTLGLGLPGVRRMVDEFSLKTKEGEGTEVSIIFYDL